MQQRILMKIILKCSPSEALNDHELTLTTEEFENINFIDIVVPTKFKVNPNDSREEEAEYSESFTVLLEDFYLALKAFYEKKQIEDQKEFTDEVVEALKERSVETD